MGLFDPVSVDTQEDSKRLAEALATEPAKPGILAQITIGDLYVFLLKLMVAGFLATAPIYFVIWLINYAATH
jgi:hypothetical protein